MRFAVSTALFAPAPLGRDHLADLALHGFTSVELAARPGHFDVADPAAVDALAGWLEETGVRIHAVHVPLDRLAAADGKTLSLAAREAVRRAESVRVAKAALGLARTLPYPQLVLPFGTNDASASGRDDNHRESARKSLDELGEAAADAGVRLALATGAGPLSRATDLITHLDEQEFDDVGVCLDVVSGADAPDGVVDAIEEASGHLVATHLADVRTGTNGPLVPFDGAIDWAAVVFAFEKVGFDGVHLLHLPPGPQVADTLARARAACLRLDELSPFHAEQFTT